MINTSNGTSSYDFEIFRKPVITNVQIKSNSNIAPNISVSVFKVFLFRAYKISSKNYIDEEIQSTRSQRMVMKEKLWKRYQKII